MTTGVFHIRNAEAEDIDNMVPLLKQLFALEEDFFFDRDNCRTGLAMLIEDGQSVVLVAEAGERIVGMCSGQQNISTASGGLSLLVEDVVVDQQFRKAGIGTALLNHLLDRAARNGFKRAQLLADESNSRGLEFYAGRGWQSTRLVCLKKTL